MADLLTGIDFRNKRTGYTKQELPVAAPTIDGIPVATPEMQAAYDALMRGGSLCEAAEAFYESSLGYVAPESDPA